MCRRMFGEMGYQSHLVYVVRATAFGRLGGFDIMSPKAPIEHSHWGCVLGFRPEAIGVSWVGCVVEGYSLRVRHLRRGIYTVQIAIAEKEVDSFFALLLCHKLGGLNEQWEL